MDVHTTHLRQCQDLGSWFQNFHLRALGCLRERAWSLSGPTPNQHQWSFAMVLGGAWHSFSTRVGGSLQTCSANALSTTVGSNQPPFSCSTPALCYLLSPGLWNQHIWSGTPQPSLQDHRDSLCLHLPALLSTPESSALPPSLCSALFPFLNLFSL
jgi:hypothetical protein